MEFYKILFEEALHFYFLGVRDFNLCKDVSGFKTS